MWEHERDLKLMATRARHYKKTRSPSAFHYSIHHSLKSYLSALRTLPSVDSIEAALRARVVAAAAERQHVLGSSLSRDAAAVQEDEAEMLSEAVRGVVRGAEETLEAVRLIVFHLPPLSRSLSPLLPHIKHELASFLHLAHAGGVLHDLAPRLKSVVQAFGEAACEMSPLARRREVGCSSW
ncbi:hypothetical protein JCM6882_003783 [Rhodosporidiobolus microsporus]